MNKLFVFDLDDTLIDNVHDYSEPIMGMARIIISELGSRAPHVSSIIAIEDELDLRRKSEINPLTGEPFGYSRDRFPGTLVETYRFICKKVGAKPVTAVETKLYFEGNKAFDPSQYARNIKPRAGEVLNFLRSMGNVVMICTAGDLLVQNYKLSALRSRGISFHVARVVDKKTPDVFRELAGNTSGYKLYSVGNNYKSDIEPALEVGYSGVYIPAETWETIGKMDKIKETINKDRCLELASLSDLMERYEALV